MNDRLCAARRAERRLWEVNGEGQEGKGGAIGRETKSRLLIKHNQQPSSEKEGTLLFLLRFKLIGFLRSGLPVPVPPSPRTTTMITKVLPLPLSAASPSRPTTPGENIIFPPSGPRGWFSCLSAGDGTPRGTGQPEGPTRRPAGP